MASLRAELSGHPGERDIGAVPAETGEPAAAPPPRPGMAPMIFAVTAAAFWLGAAIAFLWGYYGPDGLSAMAPHVLAFAAVIAIMPPFLFVAAAFAVARAAQMGATAQSLADVAQRLTAADETATASAQRLGRAVRRELDALSAGLDSAFTRLRALETALEDRVAQLEDASARAGVKTETIALRLREEREGIETLAESLDQAASRAAESLAGRAAQVRALIESVGGELKAAGQVLDAQAAHFRDAAEKAAAAPQAAAVELDRQAKAIESAADNAVTRAEFVLARQERQRSAMNELLTRLQDETGAFETMLEGQRSAIERASDQLAAESERLDTLTDQGLRRLDAAMSNAASRTLQLTGGFGKEADRVKEAADNAALSMTRLVDSLREASASAQALMDETTADAKRRSKDFVGEAMGQCDQFLRAASSVAEQAEKARAALGKAAEEAERHIVALPGVAAQEAERVREALRGETERMLDISARTLATLHTRAVARRTADEARPEGPLAPDGQNEGLRGLARRITQSKRKGEEQSKPGAFELSDVLAAAENESKDLKNGATAALGALQAALSDLAGDLDAAMRESESPDLWRRYLDGDRGVFARTLAGSIGPETVDHITQLYRDNQRFHEAADAYLQEFESLLERAREGDRDGFLASTLLSADTGKIYLVVGYALGRLD